MECKDVKVRHLRLGSRKGQMVVEQALILPAALAVLIAALGVMLLLLRGVIAHAGAQRAARAVAAFDDPGAQGELLAALPPQLFIGGIASMQRERLNNDEEGSLQANGTANRALVLPGGAAVAREAPVVPALLPGLSNAVLQGGDAPSVYCRSERGYRICGLGE